MLMALLADGRRAAARVVVRRSRRADDFACDGHRARRAADGTCHDSRAARRVIEWRYLVVFLAAFVAGAINSVAGGGTLLSFPSLIWVGLPSTIANATSTVAIWPGSLGALWGYRRDLRGLPAATYSLIVPSILGGMVGAMLLVMTPTDGVRSAHPAPDSLRHAALHAAGTGAAR